MGISANHRSWSLLMKKWTDHLHGWIRSVQIFPRFPLEFPLEFPLVSAVSWPPKKMPAKTPKPVQDFVVRRPNHQTLSRRFPSISHRVPHQNHINVHTSYKMEIILTIFFPYCPYISRVSSTYLSHGESHHAMLRGTSWSRSAPGGQRSAAWIAANRSPGNGDLGGWGDLAKDSIEAFCCFLMYILYYTNLII